MRKTGLLVLMIVFSAMLFGQNILLWDNDNYSSFIPPGGEFFTGCEVALGRSLINNGINYTETTILPGDLTQFDAVFVTLGVYCLS
ncbi:MAG: hypothetical protein P9L91_05045 [Candidatus Zophobacter franzmannii]|jgi:hypothetical protein|nr:hypothetical protein [Candidatus Zophobacter franzmannii]